MSDVSLTEVPLAKRDAKRPKAIRVHRPSGEPVELLLREQRRYTFGRAGADVILSNDRVSRLHGMLRYDHGAWRYVDLGSTNGSFLCTVEDLERHERTDEDLPAHRLDDGESTEVLVGHILLLGTRTVRLELLSEVPEHLLADASQAAVSRSAQLLERQTNIAAHTFLPVFLLGPSGCGKTHTAKEIHERSGLSGAFELINCARLPTDVASLHSELLGHEKGAFTGADEARLGKFQNADGGTLFLDEVESLSETAQGFLLDILEGEGIAPFGAAPGTKPRAPKFRLISASKTPLSESNLRRDLAERLVEGHIMELPRLEERREDIPLLIAGFIEELEREHQIEARFEGGAIAAMREMSWPGQIRELRSTVRTLINEGFAAQRIDGRSEPVVVTEKDVRHRREHRRAGIGTGSRIPVHTSATPSSAPTTKARALTADQVRSALEACEGNKTRAAKQLGIARNTLVSKMRRFGIKG